MLEIWHKDTLQGEQDPQADTGQAQRQGSRRQEEWGPLLLLVFSHRLWRGVH